MSLRYPVTALPLVSGYAPPASAFQLAAAAGVQPGAAETTVALPPPVAEIAPTCTMTVPTFPNLPVADIEWGDRIAIENEILGDPPDWERFKKAHLWHDPLKAQSKAGFKLLVARVNDGRLTVVKVKLTAAIAALNGAGGGVGVPPADRKKAFDMASRYLLKLDPNAQIPPFKAGRGRKPVSALGAGTLRGIGVPLRFADETPGKEPSVPEVKWIHLATEGEYRGYIDIPGGIELTPAIFQSFKKNLRADPRFVAGPDGLGSAKVLRFDYEHASAEPVTSGSVPVQGTPSPAWLMDLDIRAGDDGKAQLWGLTWLGEQVRGQIERDEYRYVSIDAVSDSLDPVSAAHTGPILRAVAFTNSPFLRGLTAIAASQAAAVGATLRHHFDAASDAEEALGYFRDLLGLPVSMTAMEVALELEQLRDIAATPETAPPGVDLDYLIGASRSILNLRALATAEEVFVEAFKLLSALMESAGTTTTPAPPAETTGGVATVATASNKETNMDIKALLARKLGCDSSDEAVLLAVEKQTQAAKAAEGTTNSLSGILKALGVDNPESALASIPNLMAAKEQLAKLAAELDQALQFQAKVEEEHAEADVAAAMTAHKLPECARVSLRVFRGLDTECKDADGNPDIKAKTQLLSTKRAAFAAQYPLPTPAEQHLPQSVVAAPGGVQLQPPTATPAQLTAPQASQVVPPQANSNAIDLRPFPGKNRAARMVAYLTATRPGFEKLTWAAQCKTASLLRQTAQVIY